MLDSPVEMGGDFRLDVLTNHGRPNIVIGELTLLFAGDRYNPAEVVMYNVAGSPARRVYIGTAVKSSGVVTSVQGFALGDRVRLPATGTILDNPFGGWHVQATQGTSLLSATPSQITGVTVNTNPVMVRR
jgi:hypothetical protein